MLNQLVPDYHGGLRTVLYEELNRRCTTEVAIQLDMTVWIPFSHNSGRNTASLIIDIRLEGS